MSTVKCTECGKGSGFDGCSHVVCPKRKHYTAQIQGYLPDMGQSAELVQGTGPSGGFIKIPTNKE